MSELTTEQRLRDLCNLKLSDLVRELDHDQIILVIDEIYGEGHVFNFQDQIKRIHSIFF